MRALMRATRMTDEEAVTSLQTAWVMQNDVEQERWEQEAEARAAAEAQEEQRRREEEQQQQTAPTIDEEGAEQSRKARSKLRAFNPNVRVGNALAPRPLSYAINKLANFEYCKLWYFSMEGCEDALRTQQTEANDSFGMTRIGELVTLHPVASVQVSKCVIQDKDLTWEQFHYAHRCFIQHIMKSKWPDEHAQALLRFFIEIESSPFVTRENGKKALLTYAARVQWNWMDIMKGGGEVFNIALINDELLESVS
ncbi:hypothetical protein H0H87_010956 [Tephrocybe sp. NHM501043]|nr:hypothetical protein H0H87_010956 [Tephrocybe sp. NHM501043]